MKNIFALAAIATVLIFSSCEDFMDIHKEYIEGGEIIYAPKPDSISFVAGKNRISFYCRTYNATNVRSIDVYWNGKQDSLIIPVKLNTGYDEVTAVLDNMGERSYTFEVCTTDNFGNKSLAVSNFGTSYGDIYQSTLNNRRIKELSMDEYSGYSQWYTAPSGLVRTEVRYQKKDGTQAIVWIPGNTGNFPIADAKGGTSVEYRSLYIPEEESVDTFATAWTSTELVFPMEYKINSAEWSISSVSDEDPARPVINLIDNNPNPPSFWGSNAVFSGGVKEPLPHWVVIDMKTTKNIARLHLYRRSNSVDVKTVEAYISNTPDVDGEWQKIGETMFGEWNAPHDRQLQIPESVSAMGRYLKLVLPDSYNAPFTCLAEVYAFGR